MQYPAGPSGPSNRPPVDHAAVERPSRAFVLRPAATQPTRQISTGWKTAPDLAVRLSGLHESETTWNLLRNFRIKGSIVLIDIFERSGRRDGGAMIKFSPPPDEQFWGNRHVPLDYQIQAADGSTYYKIGVALWDDRTRDHGVQSPITPHIRHAPQMTLWPSSLHIGVMVEPDSMMPLRTIAPASPSELKLVVDVRRKQITAEFKVKFQDPRPRETIGSVGESKVGEIDRENRYMFRIPFDQLTTINQIDFNEATFGLMISLESPPQYHRKREEEESSHSEENLRWTDWDTWYRQTDVVYNPYQLQNAVVALHKVEPVIDIGKLPRLSAIIN